jgi:hypothetical protein
MFYQEKYLKYKNKYLKLKQIGGTHMDISEEITNIKHEAYSRENLKSVTYPLLCNSHWKPGFLYQQTRECDYP